ncbi:MAG: hypothetical protein MRK00_11295 [Nitrosomonas sp.]|nr:hypothetical protein [Nitrosomonas sp.]
MKTLKITTYWSTEEAEGIYLLLDELKEAIWQSYGEDILEMHQTMLLEKQNSNEPEDFNNEPPF